VRSASGFSLTKDHKGARSPRPRCAPVLPGGGGVLMAVNCNLRSGPDASSVQLCSSHDMRRETQRRRAERASNRVVRLCHKFSCRRWTCGSTRARLDNGVLESQRQQWGGLSPAFPQGYRRLAFTMDRGSYRPWVGYKRLVLPQVPTISTLFVTPLVPSPASRNFAVPSTQQPISSSSIVYLITFVPSFPAFLENACISHRPYRFAPTNIVLVLPVSSTTAWIPLHRTARQPDWSRHLRRRFLLVPRNAWVRNP
jgi:hypothetical protein